MKKIQITGLSIWDYAEKKDSIKFDDWFIEVKHYKKVEPELNNIREILKKVFQAKYQSKVQIHLFTKEWK